MRNGLVQLGAWAAATGAAVALSWFGVHAVLTGAAFEQPTALPLPSPASTGAAAPTPTATARPQSDPRPEQPAPTSAQASTAAPHGVAPSSAQPSSAQPSSRRPAPVATTTSSVRSYPVSGGRVALDLRTDSASLVSATPDPGWQMQVWNGPQWLRVDFTKGDQANSVFVAWNGHPPTVDTVVR
ncbi:hypothetical protein J5Y04_33140 [Kitasatospora sp. RG8]|uniref:hypothetical protein n=1 Tax=Kitasatospora sp. RG8 TaxID=2820815 RepID=UPI001ADFCDAA|nr:hypothetical protein [Kitasatospora sp. RG8]MBP0454343.1 hypothetical protein [Kitasatospora sp. RG8]